MTFAERKLLTLAVWIATVAVAGLILTIDKPDLWILVSTLALAPAVVGHWFWNAPAPTLSQLIAEGRSRS